MSKSRCATSGSSDHLHVKWSVLQPSGCMGQRLQSACVCVCVCLQAFMTVSVQGSVKMCQITGFVFISLKDFSGLAKVRGHPAWRRVGFGMGCFPPSARLKIRAGLRKGRTCRKQPSVVGIVTHTQNEVSMRGGWGVILKTKRTKRRRL